MLCVYLQQQHAAISAVAFRAYHSVPFLQQSSQEAIGRDVSTEYDISAVGSRSIDSLRGSVPDISFSLRVYMSSWYTPSAFIWLSPTRTTGLTGTRDVCIADGIERNRFEDGSSSVGIRRDIV